MLKRNVDFDCLHVRNNVYGCGGLCYVFFAVDLS